MRLSTKSRYGTRLLVDLALHGKNGPVQISDISKRQNISVKYLEQVIRPLKLAGLVKSARGPKGGHVLAEDPDGITLSRVVRLLETHSDLVPCMKENPGCPKAPDCSVRVAWKEAMDAFFRTLDSYTIGRLAREIPDNLNGGEC